MSGLFCGSFSCRYTSLLIVLMECQVSFIGLFYVCVYTSLFDIFNSHTIFFDIADGMWGPLFNMFVCSKETQVRRSILCIRPIYKKRPIYTTKRDLYTPQKETYIHSKVSGPLFNTYVYSIRMCFQYVCVFNTPSREYVLKRDLYTKETNKHNKESTYWKETYIYIHTTKRVGIAKGPTYKRDVHTKETNKHH